MGGILDVVPIARFGEGGEVGRRERIEDVVGEVGLGWTYCIVLVFAERWQSNRGSTDLTM